MERQIYASEWKIMEYVWTYPGCTLMQIVKAMKEEIDELYRILKKAEEKEGDENDV